MCCDRSQIWDHPGADVWRRQAEHEVQGGEMSKGAGIYRRSKR